MTLRPLVSSQSKSSDSGSGLSMLSPANKQSTGLLLELALQIGITVSLNIEFQVLVSDEFLSITVYNYSHLNWSTVF